MTRRTAALLFALVLAWIAWAGLSPFDFRPANRVTWIPDSPGLRFEGSGIVLSRDEVAWDTAGAPARFELEVELRAGPPPEEPGVQHDFFVLADEFRTPALVLYQEGADLVVADRVKNEDGQRWYNDFRVEDVFAEGELVRLQVADGGEGPRLFLDDGPVEPASGYRIPVGRRGEPLRGRVVLGTHPDGQTPWTGEILTLRLGEGETALADYAFLEGHGPTVANRAGPNAALDIPGHFHSLRPWLALGYGDPLDVAKNLLGFVPFGYLLATLLRGRRAVLLVTIAGLALSLSIELAQTLMVSRVSSVEDLVLNTLGALGGALLARRRGRPE